MDDLTTEKQEIFDTWFNEAGEKKTQLENTYKDLLRLQKPAKEWSDRADELNKE